LGVSAIADHQRNAIVGDGGVNDGEKENSSKRKAMRVDA
jgi:hypothetical protein